MPKMGGRLVFKVDSIDSRCCFDSTIFETRDSVHQTSIGRWEDWENWAWMVCTRWKLPGMGAGTYSCTWVGVRWGAGAIL